jgi:hypothetical protein
MKNKYSKKISFENHKLGLYDIATFINDWGSEPRRGVKEKRCKIVKKKNGKVLEITIPKDTESKGGSFWRLDLPKNLTDVTFEYDIMFGEKFNFVRGGKLPGLAGGTAPGGGSKDKDGFSARLMWREIDFENELSIKEPLTKKIKVLKEMVKSDKNNKKREEILNQIKIIKNEIIKVGWHFRDLVKEPSKAFLVQYLYYPDKKGRFGENIAYKYGNNRNNKVFVESDKWYNIKMNIKLSENPKQKDTVLAWINGKKVLDEKRDLRKKKSYGINQVMFSLFFGGDDETWHTKKDEKVYFKNFIIKGT